MRRNSEITVRWIVWIAVSPCFFEFQFEVLEVP